MADLKVLQTEKEALIRDAAEVLKEAMEVGFETVVVIGIKDKQVSFRKSANVDMLRLLGAIEVAKQDIWDRWD